MEKTSEVMDNIRELLDSQRLAVLSTHTRGQPYSNLVAFAVTPDLKHLVFATTRATRKFANLLADPRVSLLIDNRTNEEADFADAAALTVLGQVSEVHGADRQHLLPVYLEKHPYLHDFVTSPNCALFRVTVARFILVNRFQDVREVYPEL